MSEHSRMDAIQGYSLLDVGYGVPPQNLSQDFALSTRLLARRNLVAAAEDLSPDGFHVSSPLDEGNFIETVVDREHRALHQQDLTRSDFSAALDAIAEPVGNGNFASTISRQASDFDRTFRLIVEDLAPYVRAIIRSDLRLAEERRLAQALLSDGGSRHGKRLRMTRASRSALEGGQRSSMRREKWFDGDVDTQLILRTGSAIWEGTAATTSEIY